MSWLNEVSPSNSGKGGEKMGAGTLRTMPRKAEMKGSREATKGQLLGWEVIFGVGLPDWVP